MKIYPEDQKEYILLLYSPPYIRNRMNDIYTFNYKSYIEKLISHSRNNLLILQIKYR